MRYDVPVDPAATDESFYLLVCMFVLGCIVLGFLFRWYAQWRNPVERVMSRDEAKDLFAQLMSERLGVAMRAAELDAIIVEKWTQWPIEYQAPLQQVLRHTQLLEEAMYQEAVERGIYPKRITTAGPMVPPPPQPDTLPPPRDADDPNDDTVIEMPLSNRKWVGGQLLKTS